MTPEELRKLMAEQEATPPVFAWDAIETKLAAPQTKKASPFWWFATAAFLLMGLIGTLALFKLSYDEQLLSSNTANKTEIANASSQDDALANPKLAAPENPKTYPSNYASSNVAQEENASSKITSKAPKLNKLDFSLPKNSDSYPYGTSLSAKSAVVNGKVSKKALVAAKALKPAGSPTNAKNIALGNTANGLLSSNQGDFVDNKEPDYVSGIATKDASITNNNLSLLATSLNDAPEQGEIKEINPEELKERGLEMAGNNSVITNRAKMPISFYVQAHAGYGVYHRVQAINADAIAVQRVINNTKQLPNIASLQLEASVSPKTWLQAYVGLGLVHTNGSFSLEEVRSHEFSYAEMHNDGTMAFHYNPVVEKANITYRELNLFPTIGADVQVLSKIQVGAGLGFPMQVQQSESLTSGKSAGLSFQSRLMYNLTPNTSLLLQMNVPQVSQVVHSVEVNSVFVGAGLRMKLN